MTNENLLDLTFEIFANAGVLAQVLTEQEMFVKMSERGFGLEEFHMVNNFMGNIIDEKQEEYFEKEAFERYVNAVGKMLEYAKMAQGYQEIGELKQEETNDGKDA